MEKTHENPNNEAENTAQNSANSENQGEAKTFSQEKLDEIVQKRLREQKEKFAVQQEEAIKNALAEYDRKSKLSAEEKRAEEEKQRQEEFERRDREFKFEKSKFEAAKLLSEKGIDIQVVDFLVDQDLEKTKENIADFEKAFNTAVEKGVKEQLRGTLPKDPIANGADGNTPQSGVAVF